MSTDDTCVNCGGNYFFNHYCGGPCGGLSAIVEHGEKMAEYHRKLREWSGVAGIDPCPECLDENGDLRQQYSPPPTLYHDCPHCEGHPEPHPVCPRCYNSRRVLAPRWEIPPAPAGAPAPIPPDPLKEFRSASGDNLAGCLRGVLGRQIG